MANSRKPASSRSAAGPLERAVDGALARHVARGANVCVALSGGIDSVVLLHALAALAGRHRLALAALHVNHGLSPNARKWEAFCRALCARLGAPLTVRRVRIARKGRGLEAAAREARYGALASARAQIIVLAHQLDDQAETVLFNLLRGTGLAGASGMAECGPLHGHPEGGRVVLRPLLGVAREDIEAYARDRGLDWVEDESNADEMLTRNWVRRRVGPLLGARFPRWREALARAATHFAEAQSLLTAPSGAGLDVAALRAATGARAKLLLRAYLRGQGIRAPAARRLDEILRQLTGASNDASIEFPLDGRVLRRYRDSVALVPMVPPIRSHGGVRGEILLHAASGEGIDAQKLDAGPVTVRPRRGGERLRLAVGRPSRTLKNLFQELGVPPWEREGLPLLYCGEELVWVPGLGVAAGYCAAPGSAGLRPEWRRPAPD